MKILFQFFSLLFFSIAIAKTTKDSITSKLLNHKIEIKLDTLKVQNIKSSEAPKPWYESNSMPWIAAIIVSGLTVAINVYIARINQKTAIQNVVLQINSVMEGSKNQIDNAKEIAIKQIENSKEIAITQFKTTLNTKNRQDWINDVRHVTSDLLVQCAMIQLEMISKDSSAIKAKKISPFFEKLVYNNSKLSMLLNHNKDEQKELLDKVVEIISYSGKPNPNATEFRKIESQLIEASRNLFEKHWEKIKNI